MASPLEVHDPTKKQALDNRDTEELTKFSLDVSHKDIYHNDPIGLPDDKDIENLKAIFRRHELARPGEIAAYAEDAKRTRAVNLNDFGMTSMGAARRTLSMPSSLLRTIEEAYPFMFRNKNHLNWFKKHFPHFNTADKH